MSKHIAVHNAPYSLVFLNTKPQSALSSDLEENNHLASAIQKSPDIKDLTELSNKKVQSLPPVNSVSQTSLEETMPYERDKGPHGGDGAAFDPGSQGIDDSETSEDAAVFTADPSNALPSYPEKEHHYVPKGVFRLFLTSLGGVSRVICLTQSLPTSVKKACEVTFLTWRFHGKTPPFVDVPVHFKK